MLELCDYCDCEVDTDTWGWGWYRDVFGEFKFHCECMEIFEGIEI